MNEIYLGEDVVVSLLVDIVVELVEVVSVVETELVVVDVKVEATGTCSIKLST